MSPKRMGLCVMVFFVVVIFSLTAQAKEDTAQMTLEKTAIPKNKLYSYTVKQGDILSTIVKSIPGITEKDLERTYEFIKELNPDINDFDNLEPGRTLLLPGKPATELGKNSAQTRPLLTPITSYKIKKGDTLYKIIRRELKVAESAIPDTLKEVKKINPQIRNVNKIYTGHVMKLPGRTVFVKTSEETTRRDHIASPAQPVQPYSGKIIEMKEKKMMTSEARLAVLKQVIHQMNGTITTSGNYYLPIPKAGQVTIDCSKIPVVELDDNTVVFVDLENRAHSNLKKMLTDNWNNYFLVKVHKDESILSVIHKVIHSSKTYFMAKSDKPLSVGKTPQVDLLADWVIYKSHLPMKTQSAIQALRIVDENNILLPNSVKKYLENNGLTVTEISEETGIVGKPEEIYALAPVPVFPITSVKDFAFALLAQLGVTTEKDVEVQLFDAAKDGFNLSIKVDVLLTDKNKKYVIYSQNLSEQFIYALKEAGHEPIFVNESASPQKIMETILQPLNIPCVSDTFIFSGSERKQAPYTIRFSGTKIKTSDEWYVINFNMDEGLRGLLHEIWAANLARY